MEAFLRQLRRAGGRSWRDQEVEKRPRLRSLEALLEPSFESSKNFNFEYEEHSKRNHPNHLPRSQRSLESNFKAFKNLNKPQIGEALRIQASELPPRTFKYEEHSKQNHPNYLPRSQSSLESSSKASRNLKKPQINETLWIQTSKAPKNFHHKPSKKKNKRRAHKEHEEQRISNKLIARDSL